MVIDKLNRIHTYHCALPHLAQALACLETVRDAAPGRYAFDGGFLLIQEGTTTPIQDGDFEAHRTYLDVQILLEGEETIAWADIDDLTLSLPYNPQTDRSGHSGKGCTISIQPGMFYICAPHDAHKACGHLEAPSRFRKAVIKLRLADWGVSENVQRGQISCAK